MDARRRDVRILVLLLALVTAPVVVGGQVAAQEDAAPSPDIAVYRIHVHENGTATWTVELRRELQSDTEREGYRRFVESVESGNVTVFEGIEADMRPLVAAADNATGRPMSTSNFSREAAIEDTVTGAQGVTSVSFDWHGFGRHENGRLVIGDVFAGSGLTIGENERLVIESDDDLALESVTPEPDASEGRELQWDGRRFFEAERPRVVYSGASLPGLLPGPDLPIPSILAAIVVLVSGFFGGLYVGRWAGVIDGGATASADGEPEDDELLTDEDKIAKLLEEHEGRMKQAEIVDSTGWSKSKVSMVLSEMEDRDEISKLRLGRENVIDLERE